PTLRKLQTSLSRFLRLFLFDVVITTEWRKLPIAFSFIISSKVPAYALTVAPYWVALQSAVF
ncbi:TPA: hypothetical protein I7774_23605, partial [Vibrio vulnificus]|nr:hypothetical protein [Vibrio vulnificus]